MESEPEVVISILNPKQHNSLPLAMWSYISVFFFTELVFKLLFLSIKDFKVFILILLAVIFF